MLHPVACSSAFRSVVAPAPAARKWLPAQTQQHHQHHRRAVLAHQKGNLADDLLDYVTAGPKMRKWYGQAPRSELEEEREERRQQQEEEEPEEEGDGSAVLVTDADTPMGEQVVLQLILARAEIKALVRDVTKAKEAYGPYVQPLSFDASNQAMLTRALRGCGSVVCLGRAGAVPQAAAAAGVAHVVLLSAVGSSQQGGFLSQLFGGEGGGGAELPELRDASREAAVRSNGRRYSIVRVQGVRDVPGGQASLRLVPAASDEATGLLAPSELVAREDLARVVVQALLRPPTSSRTFQVVSATPGVPPQDDAAWASMFDALQPASG